MEELDSILKIINAEAKQRMLEHADEFKDGHTIGIKCDNCQHTKFNTFGQHRERRSDGNPGYVTVIYMCCERCREMIFLICQSTLFVPTGPGKYKPHWNSMDELNNQIQAASIKHFEQYENAMGEAASQIFDWIPKEKMAVELIDWV